MDGKSPERQRCIFLLSLKSSGSSILQRKLAEAGDTRVMAHTPHSENETLYWTKAASVLGLPQFKLENSEVPISPQRARMMLLAMIRANAPAFGERPLTTRDAIFAAWTAIVQAGPGTFIEKSPHHLYQPSVVELMEDYADHATGVDVRFIGLVRNPMDTLYSSWRRFGALPKREERHWVRAYTLLQQLRQRRPDCVTIIRYEDLIDGSARPGDLAGSSAAKPDGEVLHSASLQKWRNDPRFRHSLDERTRRLARSYGYSDDEIINPNAGGWWLHRVPRAAAWAVFSSLPFSLQRRIKTTAKAMLGR